MSTIDLAEKFVERGYVRIEGAFGPDLAAACRDVLWSQLDAKPDDPATWTEPVVRLGDQAAAPFGEAANTPRLRAAFDLLVGPGRWAPRASLGTFPVRFPSDQPPGDDGWHLDASFLGEGEDPSDFFRWRVNLASRGRALLMLFLFSDVEEDDAPTRIRVGSHLDAARLLAPYGEEGLTVMQISRRAATATADHPAALATGRAGDVFLCHPFLVHAAQAHHGSRPRFLAQPPLHPIGAFDPVAGTSPVELAIRRALV
jgi:hypothetical protein